MQHKSLYNYINIIILLKDEEIMWCKVAWDYSVFHLWWCCVHFSTWGNSYRSHFYMHRLLQYMWVDLKVHVHTQLGCGLACCQYSTQPNVIQHTKSMKSRNQGRLYLHVLKKPTLMTIFYWQKKTFPLPRWLQRFSSTYCRLPQFFITHLQRQKVKP